MTEKIKKCFKCQNEFKKYLLIDGKYKPDCKCNNTAMENCCICLEDYNISDFITLSCGNNHKICNKCHPLYIKQFKNCPLCRKINNNKKSYVCDKKCYLCGEESEKKLHDDHYICNDSQCFKMNKCDLCSVLKNIDENTYIINSGQPKFFHHHWTNNIDNSDEFFSIGYHHVIKFINETKIKYETNNIVIYKLNKLNERIDKIIKDNNIIIVDEIELNKKIKNREKSRMHYTGD